MGTPSGSARIAAQATEVPPAAAQGHDAVEPAFGVELGDQRCGAAAHGGHGLAAVLLARPDRPGPRRLRRATSLRGSHRADMRGGPSTPTSINSVLWPRASMHCLTKPYSAPLVSRAPSKRDGLGHDRSSLRDRVNHRREFSRKRRPRSTGPCGGQIACPDGGRIVAQASCLCCLGLYVASTPPGSLCSGPPQKVTGFFSGVGSRILFDAPPFLV